MCDLCESKKEGIVYKLCDSSDIYICEDCGKLLYGKVFIPIIDSRLFHFIMLLEYVDAQLKNKKNGGNENV